MVRACSTNGGEKGCIYEIGVRARRKETTRETETKWIILKLILREIGCGGDMDWIDVAQDRDQRRDVVNTVMNLRIP
jgi:hypothetical protein